MNMDSLHNVLIMLHSASATVSFFAGTFLMVSPLSISGRRFFSGYWWSLVGMVILLAAAILVYWADYSGVQRIVFPGLLALGLFMLYRASSAKRLMRDQPDTWEDDYLEHIGFTLISLFEGFVIVSGLNSGLPGWLVAVIAIFGILVGRWLIRLAQRRARA